MTKFNIAFFCEKWSDPAKIYVLHTTYEEDSTCEISLWLDQFWESFQIGDNAD